MARIDVDIKIDGTTFSSIERFIGVIESDFGRVDKIIGDAGRSSVGNLGGDDVAEIIAGIIGE